MRRIPFVARTGVTLLERTMTEAEFRTVTKRELVNRIADDTGQMKVVVRLILQKFLHEVIDELSNGNRLEFRDFGVFEVRERKARVAQNPRTLEKVEVPAKRAVKFKVGRVMRERVCEGLEADSKNGLPDLEVDGEGVLDAAASEPTEAGGKALDAKAKDRKGKGPQAPPNKPGSPF